MLALSWFPLWFNFFLAFISAPEVCIILLDLSVFCNIVKPKKKRKIGMSKNSEKKIGRFLGKKKERKIGKKKKQKFIKAY